MNFHVEADRKRRMKWISYTTDPLAIDNGRKMKRSAYFFLY